MAADPLGEALAALVEGEPSPDAVRPQIDESWHRSLASGLRPDQFEVPYVADVDRDALVVRVAAPVLGELAEDLSGSNIGILLTDAGGHVLGRWVTSRRLEADLDHISLAPGFVYAEGSIGTNAIGTALAQRGPSFVEGREHFADALTGKACAAVPLRDPRRGSTMGAIDLTCSAAEASPLLLPMVRRAGREIEQRLIDASGIAERALLQRFLQLRRGAKGPLILLNGERMITNAAADRVVVPEDASALWAQAAASLGIGGRLLSTVVLRSGTSVTFSTEPLYDRGSFLGVMLRLNPRPSEPAGAAKQGWAGLSNTERRVADVVVEGLTNREVGEQLFMSRFTVDSHLRSIFRKLGVSSRMELTRLALNVE